MRVDRTALSPHLALDSGPSLPLPASPSCDISSGGALAAGIYQITRNTTSPFRDQDPGIWWSPTCQTQTTWEHFGSSRAKDMSKGIAGSGSRSQYLSSHTRGSSHRPLPPALSQIPGLAAGVCTGQENSSPSRLHSHVLSPFSEGPCHPGRLFTQPASLDNSQRC